jgi:hypothetical protein
MTRRAASGVLAIFLSALLGCATAPPEREAPTTAPPVAAVADVAPATPPESAAPATVARLDAHRTLGEPVQAGALVVWPIYSDVREDVGAFATLPDAQAGGGAVVREMDADTSGLTLAQRIRERMAINAANGGGGASVGSLLVENSGRTPLLVPAGTLVRGGNQDRVIEEDVVVAADSAALVRVHCVEHGRWSPERDGVATDGLFQAVECIAPSEIRAAGVYENSQTGVWERVAERNSVQALGGTVLAGSESFFATVDAANDTTRSARDAVADAITRRFAELDAAAARPVGFAYAVGGRAVGVRAFAGPDLFRARFPAFARSLAIESQPGSKSAAAKPARVEDVVALVHAIDAGKASVDDRGTHRLAWRRGKAGWSCACRVTIGGRDVALSEDWTAR